LDKVFDVLAGIQTKVGWLNGEENETKNSPKPANIKNQLQGKGFGKCASPSKKRYLSFEIPADKITAIVLFKNDPLLRFNFFD
jgi:hypothetical protein